VILEHIILNNVQEVVPIEELVDIKRFYIKAKELTNLNQIVNEPEPIITQTIQQTTQVLSANNKYNQLHSVFQRFSSRSSQEGTNNFNLILDMFNKMTEAIEQNKLHEFRLNHNFQSPEELTPIQTSINQNQPIEPTEQAINSNNPCCSKDVTNAPFVLVSCRNPVGRPKNSTKSTVTSFTKSIKRKTRNVVKSIKSTKVPKLLSVTKKTTTTSVTSHHNKHDDTLDDIEEISELEKNCIVIDDDDDSDLPSI